MKFGYIEDGKMKTRKEERRKLVREERCTENERKEGIQEKMNGRRKEGKKNKRKGKEGRK